MQARGLTANAQLSFELGDRQIYGTADPLSEAASVREHHGFQFCDLKSFSAAKRPKPGQKWHGTCGKKTAEKAKKTSDGSGGRVGPNPAALYEDHGMTPLNSADPPLCCSPNSSHRSASALSLAIPLADQRA